MTRTVPRNRFTLYEVDYERTRLFTHRVGRETPRYWISQFGRIEKYEKVPRVPRLGLDVFESRDKAVEVMRGHIDREVRKLLDYRALLTAKDE